MGKTHTWRMDASSAGAIESARFTSNGVYAAFARSGSIYVGKLQSCDGFARRCASLRPHVFGAQPILTFCPLSPNLLAISTGSRTSIWDVEEDVLKYTLHDSERSVTSSAWSSHDPSLLALGHVDGHISVWDLQHHVRPLYILSAGTAQCRTISWSKVTPSTLSACCGRTLNIYDLNTQGQPTARRCILDYSPQHLLWRSPSCNTVFTIAPHGAVGEWKPESFAIYSLGEDDDQDQDLFGDFEDVALHQPAPLRRFVVQPGKHFSLIGDNAVLALDQYGRSIRLFEDLSSAEKGDPIWCEKLTTRAEHLIIVSEDGAIRIAAVGYHGIGSISLPHDICERLGPVVAFGHTKKDFDQPPQASTREKTMPPRTIQPIPLSAMSRTTERKRRQPWASRATSRSSQPTRPRIGGSSQQSTNNTIAVSPREAMISSLELPKLYGEESPMPFLSPTIPSRRTSAIPALSDDIVLPPPQNESFGSLPSTAMNDSDSDDETFDGDALKGSGTLMMPGGANVPLPKSCGAFFSPNGQLTTFFPPKAKVKSADIDGLSSSQPEERSTKVSRLFTNFGNLAVEARDYEDSDTESLNSQDDTATHDSPKQELFSFPTQGRGSWSDKVDHMNALTAAGPGEQIVIVSVRDVGELIHFRPELARKYEMSCDTEEASVRASLANADVARAAGLEDIASIWSLLALLFHDEKLLEDLNLADGDVLVTARQANRAVQSGPVSRPGSAKRSSRLLGASGSLSKIGASWLVEQIFAWTELRADVQMLACISAVLLSSAQSSCRQDKVHFAASDSDSSLVASDYFVDGASHSSHPFIRSTPVLHADSRDGSFLTQSPAKPTHSSRVSSRNPSQPTTPYVDSLSSTPPFPFPKLSRQGSRLSASGSASPEHHRSSFGAAAKFYAQSITDKISSYGTSPPARRFGTSPNNELSSSLPGAGSWSKSVSFASGVDRGSRASVRIAPDDNGYDSDRTIEDASLPHTPKKHSGPVLFTLKNVAAFAPPKEKRPYPDTISLLSPALAAKARIWIHHYTAQLRRMDMQVEAAELDNIAGANDSAESQAKHEGILPTPAANIHKTTCSVCYCKIQSVQQVCSQCLHAMHLSCFESLMEGCSAEKMECPAGCGCSCAVMSYDDVVWDVPEEKPPPPVVRRKMSLTDPRRWRERVQGDSW